MRSFALRALALSTLAIPSSAQTAYLIDTTLDQLFSVDLTTGAATMITPVSGVATAADLAWKASTSELWTIDLSGGAAGTIDVVTGLFTPVFSTGLSGWQGMAWDEATQLFYLANQSGSNYVLDPATGVTTLLGASGFSLLTCLDVDANGDLWGIQFNGTPSVVRIDKVTGVGTAVSTTIGGFQGLGIDDSTGMWYGANTNDDSLHLIDPVTGSATLIGVNGAGVTFAKGFDIAGPGCSGTITRAGIGCVDGSGTQLIMQSNGIPCIGQSLDLGSNTAGLFSYYLTVGLSDSFFNGILLPLDLTPFGAPGCSAYTSQEILMGPAAPGTRFAVPIPANPIYVGGTFYVQTYVLDPNIPNPLPIGASDYIRVVIGM